MVMGVVAIAFALGRQTGNLSGGKQQRSVVKQSEPVDRSTLREWRRSDEIGKVRIGTRRQLLVDGKIQTGTVLSVDAETQGLVIMLEDRPARTHATFRACSQEWFDRSETAAKCEQQWRRPSLGPDYPRSTPAGRFIYPVVVVDYQKSPELLPQPLTEEPVPCDR